MMSQENEIIQSLIDNRNRENVERILASAKLVPINIPQFIGGIAAAEKAKQWHLTWFLSSYAEVYPERVTKHIELVWHLLSSHTPMGMQRDIWRTLSFISITKLEGEIYDKAIQVIVSEEKTIAVRAHAMLTAFNICKEYIELKRELALVLQGLVNHDSKGIQARSKNLLKALDKL